MESDFVSLYWIILQVKANVIWIYWSRWSAKSRQNVQAFALHSLDVRLFRVAKRMQSLKFVFQAAAALHSNQSESLQSLPVPIRRCNKYPNPWHSHRMEWAHKNKIKAFHHKPSNQRIMMYFQFGMLCMCNCVAKQQFPSPWRFPLTVLSHSPFLFLSRLVVVVDLLVCAVISLPQPPQTFLPQNTIECEFMDYQRIWDNERLWIAVCDSGRTILWNSNPKQNALGSTITSNVALQRENNQIKITLSCI